MRATLRKYLMMMLIAPLASPAFAGGFNYVVGKVEYIRPAHSGDSVNKPPSVAFSIEGAESAGTCPKWSGKLWFIGTTDQMYSMLLAHYMANKPVAVEYDPAVVNASGYCKALTLTSGNPPPMLVP